jgi:hypothetical protein
MIYPDDSDYSIMSFLFSNYELLVWVGGLELCRYPNSQNPLARFFFGIQEHQPSSPTWQIYIAITITHRTRWVMSFMVFRQLFFFCSVNDNDIPWNGIVRLPWNLYDIPMESQWQTIYILIYIDLYVWLYKSGMITIFVSSNTFSPVNSL